MHNLYLYCLYFVDMVLQETFGFDHVVDYKTVTTTEELTAALKEGAPEGIDMYYDNVRKKTLGTLLLIKNKHKLITTRLFDRWVAFILKLLWLLSVHMAVLPYVEESPNTTMLRKYHLNLTPWI